MKESLDNLDIFFIFQIHDYEAIASKWNPPKKRKKKCQSSRSPVTIQLDPEIC